MKKANYHLLSLFFLSIFLQIFSIKSVYANDVEYNFLSNVKIDAKPFYMNNHGSVVYKNYDDMNLTQIYLFKNGGTKQITYFKESDYTAIKDDFSMNDNDKIVWVQIEVNAEGKTNDYIILADPDKNEIYKISQLISENYNSCAYTTINDSGDVAWMQRGSDNITNKLFVYKDGNTTEILSSTNDIFNPIINNNGYVVYALSDYPGSIIYKIYLWDGKQHIRLDNSKDLESCLNPQIDNQNNIIYALKTEQGKRFFMFYSSKTGKISKIDVEINFGVSLMSFNDAVLENGTLLFIGKDGHIYCFKDDKLERLTKDNKNNSPAMKNEWMAWIFRDESNKGKILMRKLDKEFILDSVDCYLGLHISANGQFLFTRINPKNLSILQLYYGKINFEATLDSDSKDENNIRISPNPAKDLITLSFKSPLLINNSDVIIRDLNGRIVKKSKIIIETDFHLIDTHNLINGVYFVEINNGIEVFNKKIIISK